jgi:3-dehydroquinate synthase
MSAQTSAIRVDLAGRGYDIAIGPGLIDRAGELSRPLLAAPRVIIVSDETVAPLYGARLAASFDQVGVRTTSITVPAGESSKEFGAFGRLMNELLDRRPDRKTTLVALGGGVVGDLAGFAAGADDAACPGRLLGRRQDRHQHAPRQEPGGRLLSAAPGAGRH